MPVHVTHTLVNFATNIWTVLLLFLFCRDKHIFAAMNQYSYPPSKALYRSVGIVCITACFSKRRVWRHILSERKWSVIALLVVGTPYTIFISETACRPLMLPGTRYRILLYDNISPFYTLFDPIWYLTVLLILLHKHRTIKQCHV